MKMMKTARRALAVACVAMVASCALATSAFAATVHGADYHGTGTTIESGDIDVLNVDGSAGETVFLAVSRDKAVIAKNLPYTIGTSAEAGDDGQWAGIATLDLTNIELDKLDGTYTIKAFADRKGDEALYEGGLYGVYAKLPDGTNKLIGTRTANSKEMTARTYTAPATISVGDDSYKLSGKASGEGALYFDYVKYDPAKETSPIINYVDANGNVIATTEVEPLAQGEQKDVDIPSAVKADNGDVYRTVYFKDTVTVKNPGQMSYSIYCAQMSEKDMALSGYYVAKIKMVDGNGRVIASDSVNVTGDFTYTAPTYIYKKETNSKTKQAEVITYKINGSNVIKLSAANDDVLNGERTIEVSYTAQSADVAEVDVTFNLIDGSKRVGEKGRTLKTQTAKVTNDNQTATPPETVEVGGTTYTIVGSPSDYAYAIRSGEFPSVNVYYVPKGYKAPGAYDVTVNYVNFIDKKTIETHTYTSDPNEYGDMRIEIPSEFTNGGVDYVLLDGQDAYIDHNYYSGLESYTVYYRDKNDTLTSGTVVNNVRVNYTDGGTTTTPGTTTVTDGGTTDEGTTTTTTNRGTTNAGTTTTTVGGGTTGGGTATGNTATGNAAADGGNGAQDLRLNDGRTYNVFDGEGNNATMTNEAGVDTNTERIEDSETPLASGFDKGGSSSAASAFSDLSSAVVPIALALAVLVAIVAFVLLRRRNNNGKIEA